MTIDRASPVTISDYSSDTIPDAPHRASMVCILIEYLLGAQRYVSYLLHKYGTSLLDAPH